VGAARQTDRQRDDNRSQVTIGLIGCGRWGLNILRDLLKLRCRVVVVEIDPTNRTRAAALHPGLVVSSISEVPEVDGIVVATPATTHAAVVEGVLDRGVPVFCEKPLTTDPESALRLVEAGGDRLFVMHVWAYHRGVMRLAEIARNGELGPVLALRTERKNWTSPRTDTDAIWTLVPHDLSIGLAILGQIPTPRSAVVEVIADKAVSLIAVLGDAPFLALDCSTRFAEKRREVRLHCRDGVAILPNSESPFIEILRSTPPIDEVPAVERQLLTGDAALFRELCVFVDYLRGGPRPPTDAREGLAVVEGVSALRALAAVEKCPAN